jgi:uncharacterized protein
MHIFIGRLAAGNTKQVQREDATALGIEEQEYRFTEPISAQFTMEKIGPQIICRGLISTSVEMECSRCLEPVEMGIAEGMTLLLRFSTAAQTDQIGEEVKIIEPDADQVDVTEEVRQTVLLAIPGKPLCREDCLGLCPYCGKNLNMGSCHCQREIADPRWSGLAKFLSREKKGE